MRKVIFQYWIEPHNDEEAKLSDHTSGFFHGFTGGKEPFALIEDANSGYMKYIEVGNFRFVQPPETKTQKLQPGLHLWGIDSIIRVDGNSQRLISIKELELKAKIFEEAVSYVSICHIQAAKDKLFELFNPLRWNKKEAE